jgi:periplasmic copper chaperone A
MRWIAIAFTLALVLTACHAPNHADEAAIVAVMKGTWDKPDAPLVVSPIAVHGDAAVADWTQPLMGGRALLRRRDSKWVVVLCAGDGIRSEAVLLSAGLSATQARHIARELAEKEKGVSAERLAAMSRFRGIVRMDGESGHAPVEHANSSRHGLRVSRATIPVPPPGAVVAAGYVTIENLTSQEVRLLSAETPVATAVSLHANSTESGMARMRPLSEGLLIPAGQRRSLEPGQKHLMLQGLQRPLQPGEEIPVSLTFEPGGKVDAAFSVRPVAELGDTDHAHGH